IGRIDPLAAVEPRLLGREPTFGFTLRLEAALDLGGPALRRVRDPSPPPGLPVRRSALPDASRCHVCSLSRSLRTYVRIRSLVPFEAFDVRDLRFRRPICPTFRACWAAGKDSPVRRQGPSKGSTQPHA